MKLLSTHSIDPIACRLERTEFADLLANNPVLSERRDILPFFKNRVNLSMLICNYFPSITNPDRFAHEYGIDGDFVADLVIGDSKVHRYVLVEFEDGTPDSIFQPRRNRAAAPHWARRFEGAYSQLIDWLWKLEDKRSTLDFVNTFGDRRATFHGLIVIGKDMKLSAREKDRLKWRMDKTRVDSNGISAVSFDDLSSDLDHWLTTYHNV